MVDFDFYPHRCTVYRGESIDPITGIATKIPILSDEPCYAERGYTSLLGERMQGINDVHVQCTYPCIMPGDIIDITLENDIHYTAKIKQSYPIEDEDFGGQELKLYERDAFE